ncbi:MAG TPA: hypothetical protein VM734_00480 [Kofleriaceae bacterium]|nr:hypothetical protein [Kofleriaceae bacterium]
MTAITLRRDYLGSHRRLAVGRALLTSAAGLIPVPFLDTWLIEAVYGGAFRRIAADHQIDLDPVAVKNLVHGRTPPASWVEMTGTALAARLATATWKRFMLALTALRRAQAASRSFATLTVFDHYCARIHTGLGLDGARALLVRETINRALLETPGGLSFEPFRRGALGAARSLARGPLELANRASGGRLRRLLDRGKDVHEAEAVDEIDAIVEAELADTDGVIARTVAAVELQLTAEVNPYLDDVIERFDALWRAAIANRGDEP